MQQHVHSCQVERRRVLFLPEDVLSPSIACGTNQQRARAASRVIHIAQASRSRCHDVGEDLAHLLWRVELSSLFACTCRELRNHILVGIAQDIYLAGFIQPEVDVIERQQHIADERVLVIGSLAEFR